RRMRQRGSALVIALAVLALLFAFGAAFMSTIRLEVRASSAHVDGRRATLLAEAGINRAVVELASTFKAPLSATTPTWAYPGPNGDTGHGIPLEKAKHVSFEAGQEDTDDGTVAYSGRFHATYPDGG